MKETDKEIEKIFGKKPSPIDKKSMLNGIDSEFREAMIGFIRGFGLKNCSGEYCRIYDDTDFSTYSNDQISNMYMDMRKKVADAIINGKKNSQPSAYYLALCKANETVKDNSISILLESK